MKKIGFYIFKRTEETNKIYLLPTLLTVFCPVKNPVHFYRTFELHWLLFQMSITIFWKNKNFKKIVDAFASASKEGLEAMKNMSEAFKKFAVPGPGTIKLLRPKEGIQTCKACGKNRFSIVGENLICAHCAEIYQKLV